MKLKPEELKEYAVTLFKLLCSEGLDDVDAMGRLGLDPGPYSQVKATMFDLKAEEIRTKPTEHVYVQYLLDQSANIRALTGMIEQFKVTKQYNALVGAVRVRSDIMDKLITKGQEFGLIAKTPERREIVNGVIIANLSNEDLKLRAQQELRELNKMMRNYGERDLSALDPGPTHFGPALPPAIEATAEEKRPPAQPTAPIAKPSKSQRANTSKVSSKTRGPKQRLPR